MTERRIHTMWKMIAISGQGRVFAVFPSAFSDLVETLLPELEQFEKISFKMAASAISAVGSRQHLNRIPEWQSKFVSRLFERWSEIQQLLRFSLSGSEAHAYLRDILESYRGNHHGEFEFSIDELHGHRQTVLTMNTYDAPSLWQKAMKTERSPRRTFVIPVSDIEALYGISPQLLLKTRTSTLHLTENGSIIEHQ
jgi:hypothetical protein